jgi:hypothetical protein
VFAFLFSAANASTAQTTHALVVSGVSGEPRFAEQFERDVATISGALRSRFGTTVISLTEPRSEKAAIIGAIQTISRVSKPGDQILIVLLGHGSAGNGEPRFNIPRADITASELAGTLHLLKGRAVAVIVATSASGAFLEPLAGENRVIVTATKSAAQNEEVIFPQYFAKALREDVADINKDGAVSLTEAVEYTKREVARFYQQQSRIATEHAATSGETDKFVLRAPSAKAAADPAAARLYSQREQLQKRIDQLKARKSEMQPDVYETELGNLLVELARIDRAIRAAGGK